MPSVTGAWWRRWPALLAAMLCLVATFALAPRARAASGAGTIVYTASDGIYTVSGSGGTPQRIWAAPAGQVGTEPRWSPDGTRIAFIGPDGNVWLMNADGGNAHALTSQAVTPAGCGEDGCTSPGSEADSPRWSPDGASISYRLVVNLASASLWSVSASGGTPHQLASATSLCLFNEGWSPAGTPLFSRCAGDSGPSNVTYAAAGGAAQPFVAGSQLAFSADGSRLAFSSHALQNGAINVSLFIANADGSDARMVAPDGQDPIWSANGLVAYRVGETDGWAIHVYDPASGRDTDLGTGVAEAWSPDGSWLLFSTTGDSGGTLWRMHADGSGRQQIGTGMAADWSHVG
jgi:Tol biopolymer transport system component